MRFIFTTSDSLASKAIRAAEGGDPSHVGIALAENVVIDSTFLHGGVKAWGMGEWLKMDKRRVVADITFPVPNETAGLAWLGQQMGKPYDTLGVLGMALWRDAGSENRFWCSELALGGALAAGKLLVGRHRRMGVRLLMELAYAWSEQVKQ